MADRSPARITCFAIMPFAAPFDPVFVTVKRGAESAVPGTDVRCYWLKDEKAAGQITDDIVQALRGASLCIADVTGHNPNVMWEAGYAMALGKPTVLISQDVEKLPFDIKVARTEPYALGSLDALEANVRAAVAATVERYRIIATRPTTREQRPQERIIAVTGSSTAEAGAVRRRIENLLGPYLSPHVLWYCGTNGLVDEETIDYLLANRQRVVAWRRVKVSERVRQRIEAGEVPMRDPAVEALPRGLKGRPRDVLFATRADLVILIWDGSGGATGKQLATFQESGTTTLLGFV